ncbi:hypothetical protein Tco_0796828 [Tanacetum coccineum]
MLKKFGLEDSKPMKTPMSSDTKLTKDEKCESVDSTKYQGMICSLLYQTASRPDIIFSVCLCACFQEAPKASHFESVKRIFRYIKGTTHLRLWYPKGTGIKIVVYADFDHAGDYVHRKSTSEFGQILGVPYKGDCSFSNKWSLDDLPLSVPTDGPYQTNPPSPNDIKLLVQIERQGVVTRIRHEQEIAVEDNQILTREITDIMKTWVDIIRENVFCLGVIESSLCLVRSCHVSSCRLTRAKDPKGLWHEKRFVFHFFLIRLDQPSSSHPNNDENDGNDEGTSRASTPPPTRFVNSLTNEVP